MVPVNTLATPVEVLKAWAEPHLDKVIGRATEDTGDSIENLQPRTHSDRSVLPNIQFRTIFLPSLVTMS